MHNINFTVEEQVWVLLQTIPKGKRSKLVNQAIRDAIEKEQRSAAVSKLQAWKKRLKPVSDEQILKMLHEDRNR